MKKRVVESARAGSRRLGWAWLALGCAIGCGDAGVTGPDALSSSTTRPETATSTGSTSGSTPDSSSGPASSSAGATAGSSSGSTSSPGLPPGIPPGFLVEPDLYGTNECSRWDQNCPPGHKCAPWANDGGNAWNALRCVPVASDPDGAGEPCTVEGSGVTGIDSCDAQSMCFDVDENLEGTCYPQCVGSESNPHCSQPDHVCMINGDGLLTLCVPTCNPLLSDCGADASCVPAGNVFTCAPDASGPDDGAAGDSCEFVNACDPGLLCADADRVGSCSPGSVGCCTPVCDVSADDCPPPQSCVPWFEPATAPFGQENVGVCLEVTR